MGSSPKKPHDPRLAAVPDNGTASPRRRVFLFLQMPQSGFGHAMGRRLRALGHRAIKIAFCGGDVMHWHGADTRWYRDSHTRWPEWVGGLMEREGVTDVIMVSDIRSYHIDALSLARQRGINTWIMEEGYYRPGYVTLETDGVNGYSGLPKTPEALFAMAKGLPRFDYRPPSYGMKIQRHVVDTAWHHVGNVCLFPLFWRYRTHRPSTIARDLVGLLPRFLNRRKLRADGIKALRKFNARHKRFFFYPLQISGDSQVRLFTNLGSVRNTLAPLLTSFKRAAPKECGLVIRSHPLDSEIVTHRRAAESCIRAMGLEGRVCYVDYASTARLVREAAGVVVLNSTVGLSALVAHKPVFCLGEAVYRLPGLAVGGDFDDLDGFWRAPTPPQPGLVDAFLRVIARQALIQGNFHTPDGIDAAIDGCFKRFGIPPIPVSPATEKS